MPKSNHTPTPPSTRCRFCQEKKAVAGTDVCDQCWQIQWRIEGDPRRFQTVFETLAVSNQFDVPMIAAHASLAVAEAFSLLYKSLERSEQHA